MPTAKTDHGEVHVWIDGGCSVCRQSRRWIESRDAMGRFRFHDARQSQNGQIPASQRALLEAVHVELPGGRLAVGFDAWLGILRWLPGWRWVAFVANLPPCRWIGSMIYGWIASNRPVQAE